MAGMACVATSPANSVRPRVIGESRRHGVARRPQPVRPGARAAAPKRTLAFDAPSFAIGILVGAVVVLMFEFLPALLAPPPPAPVADQGGAPAETGVQYQFQSLLTAAPTPVVAPEGDPVPVEGVVEPPEAQGLVPGMTVSPDMTATAIAPAAAAPAAGQAAALASVPPVDEANGAAFVEDPAPVTTPEMLREVEADQPPVADSEPAPQTAPQSGGMLQAASFANRSDAERLRAELLLLDLPADTSEFTVSGRSWYRVTVGPFVDAAAADQARERLRARNLTAIPFNR
jgi:cell division protein FtsN